jgi:hypothetical protein
MVTKDHRNLNFVLTSFEHCCVSRDRIKYNAFPEHHPLMKLSSHGKSSKEAPAPTAIAGSVSGATYQGNNIHRYGKLFPWVYFDTVIRS